MQTASGRAISFLTPDSDSITIEDIALHLSRLPRFVGATRFPYWVAQHSVHVHDIVRRASPTDVAAHLWAALHDAHEYATGDHSTPLQKASAHLLPSGWPSPLKIIQENLDRAIAKRFGIDWSDIEAVKPLVKRADMIALATEKKQLMVREPQDWVQLPEPDDIELFQISSANAEFVFRSTFEGCLKAYRTLKDSECFGQRPPGAKMIETRIPAGAAE